jgi:hypothetical protein
VVKSQAKDDLLKSAVSLDLRTLDFNILCGPVISIGANARRIHSTHAQLKSSLFINITHTHTQLL